MAVFPRTHLGLMELRNPFIQEAITHRPLWGGEKGWYINTVHHVDGLVNGVRESITTAWYEKNLKNVASSFKTAFEAPFLEQGDAKLKGADNYYRTHVPSMVKSKGIEQYTYNMLRAVPFTATSQRYRATHFGEKALNANAEGIAKVFEPHYKSEIQHMTTQNLADKVAQLNETLSDQKHLTILKQHRAIEASLEKEGVPALIRPAIVAKKMLETLKKDSPLRPSYVDLAFHGREELGRAIEAQFQAGDPYGDLMKDYNKLARRYNRLGGDLGEAEQRNAVLQAKYALLKHLEEDSSDYSIHFLGLTKARSKASSENKIFTDAELYAALLEYLDAANQLRSGLGSSLLTGENIETPLHKLYKKIIVASSTPEEFQKVTAKYQASHTHTSACNHSYNTIDFSSKQSSKVSHAHSCEDPTHNHNATSTIDAHAHEGDGGDFFHLAMARYEMLDALRKNPALQKDFEQRRIGDLQTLESLAEHLENQPEVLSEDSGLEQNFSYVTNALKATKQLQDKGHLAPDTAKNIEALLIQNKWETKDAKAFTQHLAMYTSKADHLNGHNPQVVKAWAIMAGAGGAVCANGCCAGSIFCFNEAVAVVGSLYSSITNSLHLGHHQDEKQKKTVSIKPH